MDQTQVFKNRVKNFIVLMAVAIVGILGYEIYLSTTFHLIKTNPSTSNVATTTPFLDVYFSKPLSKNSLSVSYSDPSIIMSDTISGKVLRFNITTPTNQNQQYSITINSISDTAGKRLQNIKLNFTPQYVDATNLPADQRAVLLERQQNSANKNASTFIGLEALTSNGLSVVQVQDFKDAVQKFAAIQHLKLTQALIETNTVSPGPLNGSGNFSLNFSVAVNNTIYKAQVRYSNLTSIDLAMYDQKNNQIFDSGNIGD